MFEVFGYNNQVNYFLYTTNPGPTMHLPDYDKLKSIGFLASSLSTYDFSSLYTILPHYLIKEILIESIEETFNIEVSLYLACNGKMPFYF